VLELCDGFGSREAVIEIVEYFVNKWRAIWVLRSPLAVTQFPWAILCLDCCGLVWEQKISK
jgi:hypothetical protein